MYKTYISNDQLLIPPKAKSTGGCEITEKIC